MILRKILYAITALLSFHALFCMDYYDLYQDAAFFEDVRTKILQNPKDPFYLESIEHISSSESSILEPQPERKRKTTTIQQPQRKKRSYTFTWPEFRRPSRQVFLQNSQSHSNQKRSSLKLQPKKRKATTPKQQPKRIKKNDYTITCPECGITIIKSGKAEVARCFLIHKYSKAHNEEKFNEVKEYVKHNNRFHHEKWHISCMHENCTRTLSHNIFQALPVILMGHLYTNNSHNKAEIEEVKKYIVENE